MIYCIIAYILYAFMQASVMLRFNWGPLANSSHETPISKLVCYFIFAPLFTLFALFYVPAIILIMYANKLAENNS